MALIKEYFELTKKYQDDYGNNTIVLMQVGSFFEVYGLYNSDKDTLFGSKINDFSQICELNIVDKNTSIGESKVMMAGFKDFSVEKYIKKIQDANFTAVVYVQDEAAKNTTRSLAGVFSPGTYFQTETPNLTNSITCIWVNFVENITLLKGKFVVVGIANIDIYTGKTNIFQFKETYMNNPTTYDELERFISIYNPSEVIFISNLHSEKEMDAVLNYAGITCTMIHKIHICNQLQMNREPVSDKIKRVLNCEKQPYQKEILSKFYKFHDYDVFSQNFYEYNIATQAFCFLLDFVYQHNPHLVNKIFEPNFENCSTRLVLANHTLKQLNIINDGNVKPSKLSCVSQMLNECLTPMGKRQFMNMFLNPVYDEIFLKREYDITEHFISKYTNYSTFLKNSLSTIKDISKWGRQIFLKKITPKSIFGLYSNLVTSKEIYDKICQDTQINEYLTFFEKDISIVADNCIKISDFIQSNLDIKIAYDLEQTQNFEVNFIKNGIDAELDKKTQMLKDCELKFESIRNYLSSLIENKEKKGKTNDYVKIHETEKNNFSLLCTSRRCKLLQESLPSNDMLIKLSYDETDPNKHFYFKVSKTQFSFEKQSASNNCIIDEQIQSLCKMISSIKVTMKDLISSVYQKFITNMEKYQIELESIINFITLVDVLYTKTSIALKYNYCKPQIVEADKSFVNAKNLRHTLIEQFQNNEIYVSNDIVLGNNDTNGILLYGTNAVGKTSLIKALGISIVMAQAGLFVPCSAFLFKPYKYIFSRIIGNDNIFKGLSTFAVEMSELRTILRLVDQNSLVLGDELCSGTETMSAISIFVAGIQRLHKCNSSFIFATHLHEIVDFEEITSLSSVKLKHMSVIYDKEQEMLIYDRKMKDGPGNNMYGLEVCKSLNLPDDFITYAYEIRSKYSPESGSILSLKHSHYNAKKLMGLCEKCNKNPGQEVHHLSQQKDANENGIITNTDSIFHKNNIANLMTLCEKCHDEIHREQRETKKPVKKVKTTKGYKIMEI
jgi:DNA mismatch repair protein MutS